MFIQRVNDAFDPEEGLKEEVPQKLLMKQLDEFPDFVKKLSEKLVEA